MVSWFSILHLESQIEVAEMAGVIRAIGVMD